MTFESASEALRWIVKVSHTGVSGTAAMVEKDDEEALPENIDSGPSDPMLWANIIHAKTDIENAFIRCFPTNSSRWVQKVMIHWAVDGYQIALDKLHYLSPYHRRLKCRTHEGMLFEWICKFTDELIRIKYLDLKIAYSGVDASFLLTDAK